MKAQKKATRCNEVVVDYKQGVVELDWKAGQRFDYAAIKKATVKAADMTLKGVSIVARGSVLDEGTNAVFVVSGTGERFVLEDNGKGSVAKLLASKSGRVIRITGDVRENKKGGAGALIVSDFQAD